jgi:predicted RNA binding protein YcfA (HicA-like mRNA interferase family)
MVSKSSESSTVPKTFFVSFDGKESSRFATREDVPPPGPRPACSGPSTAAHSPAALGGIKLIEADGWKLTRMRGGAYRHATKSGTVTVVGHPSADLASKISASTLKQAGLK